ncbi:efflux transporter outer membrane subunit [Sphingobacterium sp. Mn56C]|uniref:efflux transporter outer membrane subunit n=1 Tax=Sphingobacterium sp. Mn56C TaxID=3395261 RepID=UPI003BE10DEF
MKKYNTLLPLLGILTILILLHGCKVGQKYKQPQLQLPERFRTDSTLTNADDTLGIAEIKWRDFFQDSTLIALIDSALHFNYDMKTALLNITIAQRQLLQNKANYFPTVTADIASANKQWRSSDFNSGPSTRWYGHKGKDAPEDMYTYVSQFGTQLNFSWELDIWGKISNNSDKLNAAYLNTHEARKAIQTKLITEVAQGYFNLLMLDAKIEVARRNVQLNDSTLHMIQLQYASGEISALAIQQTESQRLLAESLVPELEKQMLIQENTLQLLTGRLPDRVSRIKDFDGIFGNKENFDLSLGSPVAIVRNRPDIRSAELALISANADANINQALRYPTLALGGALGVNAMLPKNWFNIPGALLGNVSGSLTAPIFKNRTLKTNYEVAKLNREKAELGLQQTVLEAVNEVSNAIITVSKQHQQLDYAKKRVNNAQLAVRNAGLLFRSGYATYLEVITAQSNALNSDLALVELEQKQLEAYVNLYRSLGGGWQ